MNLNFFNSLEHNNSNKISNNFINSFIKELQNALTTHHYPDLNKIDLYTIDRFEGDNEVFAVCENRRTGKMVDIPIYQISPNAVENDIIRYKDGIYIVDEAQNRIIGEKMKKLSEEVFENKKH